MLAAVTHRLITTALLLASGSGIETRIRANDILVVPGTGAENITLGQNTDEILSLKGYPDRISESKTSRELFRDVFSVKSPTKIYFDKIYYFEKKGLIVFFKERRVSAIAGLSSSRVTENSASLAKGADYFLFNYGNKYLRTIKNKDNRIYLYSKLGIAIVDDMCDDVIDMYIVFAKERLENNDK